MNDHLSKLSVLFEDGFYVTSLVAQRQAVRSALARDGIEVCHGNPLMVLASAPRNLTQRYLIRPKFHYVKWGHCNFQKGPLGIKRGQYRITSGSAPRATPRVS